MAKRPDEIGSILRSIEALIYSTSSDSVLKSLRVLFPDHRINTGGDLGGLGERSLQKHEVGDGPSIRPPIFLEVVLSDSCESTS